MYLRAVLIAALAVALAAAGWHTRSVLAERDQLRTEVKAKSDELGEYRNAYAVTSSVLTSRIQSSAAIKETIKHVQVEVERRIPAAGGCELPPDWRVLHDHAAIGTEAPPTAGADDAPVTAQEAASTVADNYGICRDNADRLTTLQQWVKETTR